MTGYSSSPMLKAAGLWMNTSAKGKQYFSGRLGGVKILILENRDRKTDSDPSHTLFFVEAAPKQPASDRKQGYGNGHRPAGDWQAPIHTRSDDPPRLPFDADDTPEWAR
jgi:hypothetical protein